MAKLHMRLSVEIDVTDEELQEIVDRQLAEFGRGCDVEYAELPRSVQVKIETKQFEPCDWDDGGYIPENWFEYDMADSGLYEVSERGIEKKTVLDAVYDQYVHDKNLPDEEDEE